MRKVLPRPSGDKEHSLILLVTSHHVPGPLQGADLSWTLVAFPWDSTRSSSILHSACRSPCSASSHILFPLYFSARSEWCPAIPRGGCCRSSGGTSWPYRLGILHPFLDIQEHKYTGSNSILTHKWSHFLLHEVFLRISSFQEKTKMRSCAVPWSLRNTNIIFQSRKQLHCKPSRHKNTFCKSHIQTPFF